MALSASTPMAADGVDRPHGGDVCQPAESCTKESVTVEPESAGAQTPTGADVGPATCSIAPAPSNCEATAGDDGSLSFQRNMWDRYEVLVQQCMEPSERLLESVAAVLRSRAELERKYGESLVSLPNQVQLGSGSSSVQSAVEAVMVNFRSRGEQSLELSEQIDTDVALTFEEVARQHKSISKKIHYDMQSLQKYCLTTRKAHSRASAKYGNRCAEAEMAAQESVQSIARPPAERAKLAQRAVELTRAARAAEQEYYSSIEQASKARALYEQHMPVVLSALQDMQEKRSTCLRDGLRKLAVYETSWLRNLQYDLEDTFKVAEQSDPKRDLENFIKSYQSEASEPSSLNTLQVGVLPFWQLGKGKVQQAPEKAKEAREAAERDAYVRQLIDTEFRPLAQALLSNEPATSSTEGLKEKVEMHKRRVDELSRRAALCHALRNELISREPPGTELDAARPAHLERSRFDMVAQLLTSALNACDSSNDSWNGRDLMVLAQLLCTDGESSKPLTLLSQVYNHPIWNKVSFWDDVLFVGLCEAHSAEAIWRRSLPPGSQFVSPSMTSFLQRFVGYMLSFGIRPEQARASVNSTLRKHHALFGGTAASYAALLLQGEDAAKPVSPSGTAGGRAEAATDGGATEETKSDGNTPATSSRQGDGPCDANADINSSAAVSAPDDFEALALGLPSSSVVPDSELGSIPNDGSAHSGGDLDNEALKAVAAQRPLDDVFA